MLQLTEGGLVVAGACVCVCVRDRRGEGHVTAHVRHGGKDQTADDWTADCQDV